MKGLLVQLSRTDSEAEAALRVIEYFDALTLGSATVEALVRSAAALAECPAGIRVSGRPKLRFNASGARLSAAARSAPSSTKELADGTTVWLERPGGAGPLDAIIVERLRLSAQALLPKESPQNEAILADVALVEVVLSEREPAEERTKAIRRLGLSTSGHITVIAVAPVDTTLDPAEEAREFLARSRLNRVAHVASLDRLAAVLVQASDREGFLVRMREAIGPGSNLSVAGGAVRVGVGRHVPAMDAHESWHSALLALRFASSQSAGDAVVDANALGTKAVLAQISLATWESDPHVQRLKHVASSETGQDDIAILRAFLTCGSLRQAAAVVHMHHSTVASRLARLEEKLGWSLASHEEHFQARLALTGLLLIESGELNRAAGR